jgi:hypothetical protein
MVSSCPKHPTMNPRRTFCVLALFVSMLVASASAQVFWSSYSPAGINDDIWCVTYANGTFAAVTSKGNLLTSTNGLNWSSQTIDAGVWLVSVAYGNGTWVAVGDEGTILLSSDLKTWVHAASVTTNKLNGVLYNGSIWVAVGESGTIVESPDAQNWTLQPAVQGFTGFLHGITLTPAGTADTGLLAPVTNFLVCGANGALLGAPSNGANFQPIGAGLGSLGNPTGGAPLSQNLEAVLCVAGPTNGVDQVTSENAVMVGQDSVLYCDAAIGTGEGIGANVFIPAATAIPNVDYRGLTYGNGYWIAAGEHGTILRSTDGINWLQSFSGDSPSTLSTAALLSAAYSPQLQRFVITGTGGTILVSNPPPTVFGNVSTRGYVGSTQTFIGGFVIQGTAPRTILIRGDGPVLSAFGVANPLPDPVLTVYNSSGTVIATNTGWSTNTTPALISTAALEVGAFALPSSSADSALLLTIQPGAYTAQISSAKGNSGNALFEAYTN